MSIPTRAEAISILDEGQAELVSVVAQLSEEAMTRPATVGGGGWSAKDLLGHIAFWDELSLEFAADWQAGRLPAIVAIVSKGQVGIDAANARNQATAQTQQLDEVRKRELVARAQVVDLIRGLKDEVWSAKPFYPTIRANDSFAEILGGILGSSIRLFGHVQEHLVDLRAYEASLPRHGR